jgi:hypothetical protein
VGTRNFLTIQNCMISTPLSFLYLSTDFNLYYLSDGWYIDDGDQGKINFNGTVLFILFLKAEQPPTPR